MVDNNDSTSEFFREILSQGAARREELHQVSGPCKCQRCMAQRMLAIREKLFGNPDAEYLMLSSNPDDWDTAKRMRRE